MASPIGSTMADLCRHRMIINITCLRCGRRAEIRASDIKTAENQRTDFRRLRYRCRCGNRRVKAYAFPADWRD